jgi:hypothetical protein
LNVSTNAAGDSASLAVAPPKANAAPNKVLVSGLKDALNRFQAELVQKQQFQYPDVYDICEQYLIYNDTDSLHISLKLLEANTKEMMKTYQLNKVKVGDNVDKETLEGKNGVPFWRLMKELTLLGYYTSEKGIQASFVYEPIPGKFEPTKLKAGQKSFQY